MTMKMTTAKVEAMMFEFIDHVMHNDEQEYDWLVCSIRKFGLRPKGRGITLQYEDGSEFQLIIQRMASKETL